MTSKEHKKHSDIARPSLGNFGRNEFAFVGTTCANVKALADDIIQALSPTYKCAYVDAEHQNKELSPPASQPSYISFIDKIGFNQINYSNETTGFQFRQLFNETDLILVNGNHYEAKKQVIVIDQIKEASLLKRIPQLSNPVLILLAGNTEGIFPFIKEAIPQWQQLPILALHEKDNIINFFKNQIEKSVPVINGLVLAGGKSVRMGYDKTNIAWHGKEQKYYMADMLGELGHNVFISCRNEQLNETNTQYKTITDTFTGLGPYGAILSAFREQPDAAWLVAASDLPLLDTNTLTYLIQHRDASAIATTFESPHDGLPEPLITIWEPKAYPILLSFLSQGYSCPRKVLRNNNVHIIKAEHPETLMNVNTPEELEIVKQVLYQKTAQV